MLRFPAANYEQWIAYCLGRGAADFGRLVRVRGVAAAGSEDVCQSGGQSEESFGAVGQHLQTPGTSCHLATMVNSVHGKGLDETRVWRWQAQLKLG